jgi:predicted nucleotidyltransferase
MIHPFIESKLIELGVIFKNHKIKRAYLFGSACTDAFNDTSDIDLLIEPGDEMDPVVKGENLWDLYYALKKLLGRDVDMITRDSLTNKYFIAELNRTSIPIYG